MYGAVGKRAASPLIAMKASVLVHLVASDCSILTKFRISLKLFNASGKKALIEARRNPHL